MSQADWPMSHRDLPVSVTPVLGDGTYTAMPHGDGAQGPMGMCQELYGLLYPSSPLSALFKETLSGWRCSSMVGKHL